MVSAGQHHVLQDIREYELDYEAARKAAAVAAVEAEREEERRIKLLEKNPLGELTVEEEEDINFGRGPLCSFLTGHVFVLCSCSWFELMLVSSQSALWDTLSARCGGGGHVTPSANATVYCRAPDSRGHCSEQFVWHTEHVHTIPESSPWCILGCLVL